jgi:hypothetical protein
MGKGKGERNMGFDVLDEYECQGQLSIEDFLSESDIPESIFGV